MRLHPVPFAVAAVACLLGTAGVAVVRPDPVESALWVAVGAVLAGAAAGVALGLTGPTVPEFDYTAAGSVVVGLAFVGLALLAGRPESGYLTAVLGGVGAALVGFDSGLKRSPAECAPDDDDEGGDGTAEDGAADAPG